MSSGRVVSIVSIEPTAPPRLLFVCTGNATRSVIGAALVAREYPQWPVASAGTFAIPGLTSSVRTLAALTAVSVTATGHRSTTFTDEHCAEANVVITFECDHVRFIRKRFPAAAERTLTLPCLARLASKSTGDITWSLPTDLAEQPLQPWMQINDPAGGQVEDFIACAREIETELVPLLPLLARLRRAPV